MLQGIYSVYDSKAQAYLQPFFCPNAAVAIRAFQQAAIDPTHHFHTFAADFTLMQIGEWNELEGTLTMLDAKINLGTALEHTATTTEEQRKHRQQLAGDAADLERDLKQLREIHEQRAKTERE